MVHLEDPVDELNDEVECMKEGSLISLRHEQSPFDNRKKRHVLAECRCTSCTAWG